MRKKLCLRSFRSCTLWRHYGCSSGKPPTPTGSPTATATPTPTPTTPSVLISSATPTLTPTTGAHADDYSKRIGHSLGALDFGRVTEHPTVAFGNADRRPSRCTRRKAISAGRRKVHRFFRLDQAVITALAQNPTVLQALERNPPNQRRHYPNSAEALPQIGPSFSWDWTDPNLSPETPPVLQRSAGGRRQCPVREWAASRILRSDITYNVQVTGIAAVLIYSTFRAIRGTFFQRDSAYFALRNTVDSTICDCKNAILPGDRNRELIVVQEESVNLLESQLKDQQNRFEAGTVPRFNVLQAQGPTLQSNPAN